MILELEKDTLALLPADPCGVKSCEDSREKLRDLFREKAPLEGFCSRY